MFNLALDLRHLRYVLTVAEHGSIRRAATELNVPQSTISRRVRHLEAQIGAPIFERNRWGVVVTDAGRRFMEEASAAAAQLSNAVSAMRAGRQPTHSNVRIGFSASLSHGGLRNVLEAFRRDHPCAGLYLEEQSTQICLQRVVEGQLDLAFVICNSGLPQLASATVWGERLMFALPASHRLAKRATLRWHEVRGEPFVVTTGGRGPEIEQLLFERLARPEFRPDISAHGVSRETLLDMVELGFGIAIVGATAAAHSRPSLRLVPMRDDEAIVVDTIAVWQPHNPNPGLRLLLERVSRGKVDRWSL